MEATQSGIGNKPVSQSYVDSIMGANGRQERSANPNNMDNVVVHDEDHIVDRAGSFPIIRFSNRVPVASESRFSVLDTMVEEQEPLTTVTLPQKLPATLLKEASVATFISETIVANHPIQCTATYLASNPEKKIKSGES
ncbi:hypothetical protein V6N12_030022 [Hibiscus sabdariffa]|uniref:Uncharacterized protein n=1 Tax=Hibiscus sabdariffa TaxID=183260 RepID=A0ABR2CJ22_9ROSI